MTNTVENESNLAKSDPAPQMEKSGTSTTQMILIVLGGLAVAALLAYQMFGCASCYG